MEVLAYLKKVDRLDSVNTVGGLATTVWFSGCQFRCPGCHNPETWNKNNGSPVGEKELKALLDDKPIQTNLAILGGEPLNEDNIKGTQFLIENYKKVSPDGKVLIWTGYDYPVAKGLIGAKLFKNVDYLKTGLFVQEKFKKHAQYYGSTNQSFFQLKNGVIEKVWSDTTKEFELNENNRNEK